MDKERIVSSIKKIIKEAKISSHYTERLFDRFLDKNELVVGFEKPNSVGEYEEIGTYVLPEPVRQEILANAKLIEGYNFPKSKSYGIQVANVMIDKSKINYISDDMKSKSKDRPILFVDSKTETNGNIIYAIIRGNEIHTIYFAKNYVPQNPSKLRVDVIIKNMSAIKQKKIR